jgi:hypothetical protein
MPDEGNVAVQPTQQSGQQSGGVGSEQQGSGFRQKALLVRQRREGKTPALDAKSVKPGDPPAADGNATVEAVVNPLVAAQLQVIKDGITEYLENGLGASGAGLTRSSEVRKFRAKQKAAARAQAAAEIDTELDPESLDKKSAKDADPAKEAVNAQMKALAQKGLAVAVDDAATIAALTAAGTPPALAALRADSSPAAQATASKNALAAISAKAKTLAATAKVLAKAWKSEVVGKEFKNKDKSLQKETAAARAAGAEAAHELNAPAVSAGAPTASASTTSVASTASASTSSTTTHSASTASTPAASAPVASSVPPSTASASATVASTAAASAPASVAPTAVAQAPGEAIYNKVDGADGKKTWVDSGSKVAADTGLRPMDDHYRAGGAVVLDPETEDPDGKKSIRWSKGEQYENVSRTPIDGHLADDTEVRQTQLPYGLPKNQVATIYLDQGADGEAKREGFTRGVGSKGQLTTGHAETAPLSTADSRSDIQMNAAMDISGILGQQIFVLTADGKLMTADPEKESPEFMTAAESIGAGTGTRQAEATTKVDAVRAQQAAAGAGAKPWLLGVFHHSSFTAGGDVQGAGTISTDPEGFVKMLSNASGHYKPDKAAMLRVLDQLTAQGVNLDTAVVRFFDSTTKTNYDFIAGPFMATRGNTETLATHRIAMGKIKGIGTEDEGGKNFLKAQREGKAAKAEAAKTNAANATAARAAAAPSIAEASSRVSKRSEDFKTFWSEQVERAISNISSGGSLTFDPNKPADWEKELNAAVWKWNNTDLDAGEECAFYIQLLANPDW